MQIPKRIVRSVIGATLIVSIGAMLMPAVAHAAPPRRLSIGDATIVEGDSGAQTLSFRITHSGRPTSGITVNYATTPTSATADIDYTSVTGSAVLSTGGCKCATVSVEVLGDLEEESTETFRVNLSGAVKATIKDPVAIGSVVDNDQPPSIAVLDAVANEGDGAASFEVSLSSSDIDTVSVDFATADGTAVAGSDYTTTTGTVTFLPGDVSEIVPVPILDDAIVEEDEQFTLTLSNPDEGTIGGAQAAASIIDDDSASSTMPTTLTARVAKRPAQVIAKGMLEAAEDGSQVRVILQVRRDGRYRKVAAKTVAVTSLADRDADTVADAAYRATFRRPAHGRYRFRVVFAGSAQLDPCRKLVRFRL